MTWVKIDDRFPDHPKALALGDDYNDCVVLHLRGLCYCAANLTDGFIPGRIFKGYDEQIERLVEVGLWRKAQGGFRVHDYLEYNPSRDEALAQRESRSERGKKGAEKRWAEERRKATAMATAMAEPVLDECPVPVPLSPNPSRSKDKPLSRFKALETVDEGLLSYWMSKSGKEPTASDALSLANLSKRYGPDVVKLAIGQACVQGEAADNYKLITTIAKAEVS